MLWPRGKKNSICFGKARLLTPTGWRRACYRCSIDFLVIKNEAKVFDGLVHPIDKATEVD